MDKFRIHVISIPHTKTNGEYLSCAFTQKVWKFCKMMKARGHYIMHYGVEGADVDCDENINVVSSDIFESVYGERDKKKFYDTSQDNLCYKAFYFNTINEIAIRKQPNDILLAFWGCGVQPIIDAHKDLVCIHPGIGYYHTSEENIEFRVFESNSLRSLYYGKYNVEQGRATDTVIPNYFDNDDFTFNESKGDYFLYLGRVCNAKGFDNVLKAMAKTNERLIVAGQLADQYIKEDFEWPKNVTYVGLADKNTRMELMSNAKASFLLTRYIEPFGGVQIENMLSGTPIITTDFGVFPETNKEGITGYRCRNINDVINAINDINEGKIDPRECRKEGEKYLLENIAKEYERFFEECTNVHNGKNEWDI